MTATMRLDHVGRRYYLRDTPYSAREAIRAAGCKWDSDERAWWTGKADIANRLIESLAAGAVEPEKEETVDPNAAVLIGRAKYKGRAYYVLAEGHRKSDGQRYAKLCARDGSLMFWVKDFSTFELVKTYRSKQSINGLKKLAQELQAEQDRGWRTTRYGWECLVCGEENGRDARDCWECGLARA